MESPPSNPSTVRIWELLALAVSVAALTGSLYLSMGMNLKACPLCIYERTFMMGCVGILSIGLLRSRDAEPGFTALLCLPLAIAGLGVAALHVNLELTEVLECPAGLFGLGSAPQQSAAAFIIVTVLASLALMPSLKATSKMATFVATVVLGVAFSYTAIKSAPPLPQPPSEPYTTPLVGCRPIFNETQIPD